MQQTYGAWSLVKKGTWRGWMLSLGLLISGWISAMSEKPVPGPDEYGKWETITWGYALSPQGTWLAYSIFRVNRERELRLQPTGEGEAKVFPKGIRPVFSADDAWLMWTVDPSEAEKEKLAKDKKPVRQDVGLLNLKTQEEQSFTEVRQASFDESGGFLAMLGYAPDEPKGKGADLRLLDLAKGTETSFGNVAAFDWDDQGSMLAMIIMTGADKGNAVQVFDAKTGRLKSLDTSEAAYRGLAWRKDGDELAVLRSLKKASEKDSAYTAMAWGDLAGDAGAAWEMDTESIAGYEVSADRALSWSSGGDVISLGLKAKKEEEKEEAESEEGEEEKSEKKPEPKKNGESAALQIWHTKDVRLFPEQTVRENRKRTQLAVWHLTQNKVVRISSDLEEDAALSKDGRIGLEYVEAPYPWGNKFGRPYEDVWQVDVASGERQMILEKSRYHWLSPEGKYLLHYDGKDYHTIELATGKQANITGKLKTVFTNMEYDVPTDMRPPYGVAGWLSEDQAVLLNDRYDVWRVSPDGSKGVRITRGAKDQVQHRYLDLDREEGSIDAKQAIYFSTWGEWSEKRGFARLDPGKNRARTLLSGDFWPRRLAKAENEDVFVYTLEARDDATDFFVAGPDLAGGRQLTQTNAFQKDYAWIRSALVDYTSEAGKKLQGVLIYPANHDPQRKYPMIVYTYEQLSWQAHLYVVPDERRYYNQTVWALNDYFVLLPDIVYRPREPGVSALEAVRPAVAKVVDMGLVDEKKVGLIGHSWGGYQAAYLPTRTNIFAASVSGAPLTDFVSFMGQIHWNPGVAEVDHWETGQARMEVPYWEDPEAHERNSPLHKVHEMETPMLMAHGNKDGVVEFFQATVFFNYARRAGKNMVLLVYEDEDHGFRKKENQIDYTRRILEWFGHYLKGEPAPSWITEGVKKKDLGEEKQRIADKFPKPEEEDTAEESSEATTAAKGGN